AVLNLLLNAISISPHGSTIEFRASVAAGELEIEVGDSGPGLPQDVSDYLNTTDARVLPLEDYRGLGIGVVKRLLHELQGSIHAEKKSPHGSRIRLSIPARRDQSLLKEEYGNVA
ncbi:MAG: ATP-binding protein, partial [Pseudomonadota bacterium]